LTTDNCTGEAFGELFLAMTDNLSSKCFAPTERLFEKYYIKSVISKNLTPLPPFPAREWGF
jgi:hypothetical protein